MVHTETGELTYSIPAPFMYDANQESTDKVELKLDVKSDTEAILTYTPDATWLNDENRVYPVIIDPPVVTDKSDVNKIIDTSIMKIINLKISVLQRLI